MSNGAEVTFYCEHTSSPPQQFHCNRYTIVPNVEQYETPKNVIQETAWAYVDSEVRCPQHHNE